MCGQGHESSNISCGKEEMQGFGLLHTGVYLIICVIESIYLANLTLKMMLTYNDGDIVVKIKLGILLHNDTRNRFSCLSCSDNEFDNRQLLVYLMERYANMRGTYFAKHLKGNSGDQIQKLARCQATRTKVAHAVVYAKTTVESDGDTFIHDNTHECQALWETATLESHA